MIRFNENNLIEVKNEEISFDDNQREVKTPKKCRKNKSNETKKKFGCDRPECQYMTNTKSELQNHMRGHDNEVNNNPMNSQTNTETLVEEINQLICQYCDKCFKYESNLSLHLKSHIKISNLNNNENNNSMFGQYVCRYSDCGQRFDNKRDLNNHIVRHKRREKRFICDSRMSSEV